MILDIMRREKKKFLMVLLIPLIFGLVAYLIPGMPGGVWGSSGLGRATIAEVSGAEISTSEFLAAYQRFVRNSQFPVDKQFLKTLQIDRQILNNLIQREVMLNEAKRLGLDATSNDIQHRILALPYFQDNGNFAFARYQAILEQNGLTIQQFEDNVREEIIQEKLRNLITDSVMVSEKELEEEYHNRNDKAKIAYVTFEPTKYSAAVTISDPDIKAYYDLHKESYRVGDQRKAKYLVVSTSNLRNSVQVSESDVRNYYQQNLSTYQLPERVRASHILLKTEGKSPEEVEKIRSKATELLIQVKQGVDFATLAKKYSEDPGSGANGGDLGLFGHGAMVPEFEAAAFKLGVGGVSDLVTTQFGFHIIKVTEKQAAHTQSLQEAENLIRPTLVQKKAEQMAQDLADKAFNAAKSKSLEQTASELKLPIEETPFFQQGASVPGIGTSADFSTRVFGLKTNEVGAPVHIPNGFAIPQLKEIKAAYVPELPEVRSKVQEAFRTSKAEEIARSKAQEFSDKAKTGKFDALAKSYSVETKTTEEFARNGNLKDLGSTSPFESFAFSAEPQAVSQPIQIGQKFIVAQAQDRKVSAVDDFSKAREGLRQSLLAPKKDRIFQSYLDGVKDKMTKAGKVKVNEAEFAALSRRL